MKAADDQSTFRLLHAALRRHKPRARGPNRRIGAMKFFTTVTCEFCGRVVRRKRHAQQFCSSRCRQAAHRAKTARRALRSVTESGDTEKRYTAIQKPLENQRDATPPKCGRRSRFDAPLNLLGGERWSGKLNDGIAPRLDHTLWQVIVRAEIGDVIMMPPEMSVP
jgi:hypothetical protein